MNRLVFLHEHPSFKDLLAAESGRLKIALQLLEKDYWLMHVLWGLQNSGLKYELKGGTSLSKGWNIISRFSEDVDVKIFPPEGMVVQSGKNHTKAKHRENRTRYFEWLASNLQVPGVIYIKRDTEFDDHDLRNAGFRLGYQSNYVSYSGLKTDVLLEVGFDSTTPNETIDISSWAYEAALTSGISVLDNRAKGVPCYLPEYTFVEKLSAILKKYRQEAEGKEVKNFTRHYYDIYQLLNESRVQQFLGTADYSRHKEARLNKTDLTGLRNNPAFSLPDISIRAKYKERYEKSSGLYFKGQPSLDEILSRIEEFLDRF